ncbi:predicted protein [Botrytis cinerea T4]|uniref:Uncharacterized protein n=1 Tax=Botryotinia fuckeliana (strain T4) TaxID=999810 RepID=G2YS21_BOTF4|nr:predicted protein [Botrytis cinerea T4]
MDVCKYRIYTVPVPTHPPSITCMCVLCETSYLPSDKKPAYIITRVSHLYQRDGGFYCHR